MLANNNDMPIPGARKALNSYQVAEQAKKRLIDPKYTVPYRFQPPSIDPLGDGVLLDTLRDRPFQGSCCRKCLPTSRSMYEGAPLTTLGLANILRVSTQNRNRSIFTRAFHYIAFVMSRQVDTSYPDVSQKVLQSDAVRNAIRSAADDEIQAKLGASGTESDVSSDEGFFAGPPADDADSGEALIPEEVRQGIIERHRKRAVQLLQRMKSCISGSLLRIAGWVLYKLLSKMLATVQFHKGQIELLKRTRDSSRTPIIYLPMHRSHLDYILVSFILYMNNLKPPLVAAGDNLLIPFFGNLMRGLGAFFIKRRLDPVSGTKDHVYRAILRSYMTENLKNGQSLEFFLEGGRSRTGKACLPKGGLLSVVVDSVLEGVVDDVYIVPVSISYEKLIDGNYIAEQIGKPKQPESFSLAAKAIWSTLRSNYGSVRVDFAQPFSMREYLAGCTTLSKSRVINSVVVPPSSTASNGHGGATSACAACAPRNGTLFRAIPSSTSLYGLDVVVSDEKRATIQELAEHVIYDGFNTQALMCTQLIAFLLLTRFRSGASLHELTAALDWLRTELLSMRRRDVGFSGESCDAVRYACNLIGANLITTDIIEVPWVDLPNKRTSNGIGSLTNVAPSNDHTTNGSAGSHHQNGQFSLINGYKLIDSKNSTERPAHSSSSSSSSEFENKMQVPFFKPVLTFPNVLELQYYANSVTSAFLCDSVVVNCLTALLSSGLNWDRMERMRYSPDKSSTTVVTINASSEPLMGGDKEHEHDNDHHQQAKLGGSGNSKQVIVARQSINREALVNQCVALAKILQYEFLFGPPCTNIASVMNDTIDNFILNELIYTDKRPVRITKFNWNDDDDSDDDMDDGYIGNRPQYMEEFLHLHLDRYSREMCDFYRAILLPYIESIWLAAICLPKILLVAPECSMEERPFIQKLLDLARAEFADGKLRYEESMAAETLKNALKLFENEQIIYFETSSSGARMISLTDEYQSRDSLDRFIASIEVYRK